jgi:hypothetical protein
MLSVHFWPKEDLENMASEPITHRFDKTNKPVLNTNSADLNSACRALYKYLLKRDGILNPLWRMLMRVFITAELIDNLQGGIQMLLKPSAVPLPLGHGRCDHLRAEDREHTQFRNKSHLPEVWCLCRHPDRLRLP